MVAILCVNEGLKNSTTALNWYLWENHHAYRLCNGLLEAALESGFFLEITNKAIHTCEVGNYQFQPQCSSLRPWLSSSSKTFSQASFSSYTAVEKISWACPELITMPGLWDSPVLLNMHHVFFSVFTLKDLKTNLIMVNESYLQNLEANCWTLKPTGSLLGK